MVPQKNHELKAAHTRELKAAHTRELKAAHTRELTISMNYFRP
jgi:hypothetical protein